MKRLFALIVVMLTTVAVHAATWSNPSTTGWGLQKTAPSPAVPASSTGPTKPPIKAPVLSFPQKTETTPKVAYGWKPKPASAPAAAAATPPASTASAPAAKPAMKDTTKAAAAGAIAGAVIGGTVVAVAGSHDNAYGAAPPQLPPQQVIVREVPAQCPPPVACPPVVNMPSVCPQVAPTALQCPVQAKPDVIVREHTSYSGWWVWFFTMIGIGSIAYQHWKIQRAYYATDKEFIMDFLFGYTDRFLDAVPPAMSYVQAVNFATTVADNLRTPNIIKLRHYLAPDILQRVNDAYKDGVWVDPFAGEAIRNVSITPVNNGSAIMTVTTNSNAVQVWNMSSDSYGKWVICNVADMVF